MIDLEMIESIKNIVLLDNKTTMQSFLGKINSMQRFISDFVETANPLQEIIKKGENYKWTKERKESLARIKEAIAEALTL